MWRRAGFLSNYQGFDHLIFHPGNHDSAMSRAASEEVEGLIYGTPEYSAKLQQQRDNTEYYRSFQLAITGGSIHDLYLDLDSGVIIEHGHLNEPLETPFDRPTP